MLREIGMDYNTGELEGYIDKFPEAQILVIGDIIMDEYLWGDVSRISPEAPVPVVDVRHQTTMLGGAANVINNIVSLGGKSVLCGVIGHDGTGGGIIEKMEELGLKAECIVKEADRATSIKTRVIAHNQQVVRFDRESRRQIGPETIEKILGCVKQHLPSLDAIIVADYGKGVISAELMGGLREMVRDSDIIIAVDPKTDHFEYYKDVDLITPNHHEASLLSRVEITDEETLIQAGRRLLDELSCRGILITQGKEGMTLFERGNEITQIPTVARKVYDVTGAGDTVISTFCLALASGLSLKSAAIISNFAAGIVVGELGTSTVKAEDLKRVIAARLVSPNI
ncbi:D-glycero-beta-D-manno-heptose-7-phosphate kinase [Thermodesulfobacteriota bacterium]